MKNIIFLLAFLLFVQHLLCSDDILSKFHQTGYKIRDFRVDLVRYNKKYFKLLELKTFKYNRTTPATNATVIFKINMEDKVEVVIQAYKFLSNEYRHFPMRFQVNLKKCVDTNAMGLASVKNCGNLTTFYFYKDVTYHVCNFVIDESRFPPLIPSGRYLDELTFLYLNKEIAVLNMLAEIYTPIAYPKN